MATSAPRTLADQLRGWSDGQLTELLMVRPDLGVPAPQDSAQLASRAATRPSVLRALEDLSVLDLAVLEAVVNTAPVSVSGVAAQVVAADDSAVPATLDRLRTRTLVWGTDEALRPLSVLPELIGLPEGPPVSDVPALLGEVDDRARAILEHLDATGARGSVDALPARLTRDSATTPTEQLVARRLLVALDARHVTVPWTVRLALHGGRSTTGPVDAVPALELSERRQELVDSAGSGAAAEVVRRVELLLDRWGTHPPSVLRGGGLGVRDLRAAATLMGVGSAAAALLVETLALAGLVAVGMTDEAAAAWLPTDEYDGWLLRSPAERWAALATAWRGSGRMVGLIGGRQNDKPVNALVDGLDNPAVNAIRAEVLRELDQAGPGQVLSGSGGRESLAERMRWLRPRRPTSFEQVVDWTLEEAAELGVTALSGITAFGRVLARGEEPAAALAALLPEPVDHVLLQADLTAVAPGPLEQDLARRLAMVADVESQGGATVYRFAATSVRRAFDAGWSATEVHDFVAATSRTPVPQALTYLVDDVSRRFGTLRVGQAEAFLRSDDETALTELVHHPQAESLRLRRIAPTVVVSDVPLATLLPRLRELGAAPVVEAADGTVRLARPDLYRARPPRRRTSAAAGRDAARIPSLVRAIRSGDQAAASRPRRSNVVLPTDVMALLREKAESGERVLIGYVGNDGGVADRIVAPRRVEGGQLTAYDERADDTRSFAIHRITRATPL